mmetsp:Transcript_3981/g.6062  ORF Transcript_3981/g.6062 Transcript_3981/m.6062 type:complete len:97 (+) Transcript_3981:46-336(+)
MVRTCSGASQGGSHNQAYRQAYRCSGATPVGVNAVDGGGNDDSDTHSSTLSSPTTDISPSVRLEEDFFDSKDANHIHLPCLEEDGRVCRRDDDFEL